MQLVNVITTEQIYNNIGEALKSGNYDKSIIDSWNKAKRDNYIEFCGHWQIGGERFLFELVGVLTGVCGINNDTQEKVILDAISLQWIRFAENY